MSMVQASLWTGAASSSGSRPPQQVRLIPVIRGGIEAWGWGSSESRWSMDRRGVGSGVWDASPPSPPVPVVFCWVMCVGRLGETTLHGFGNPFGHTVGLSLGGRVISVVGIRFPAATAVELLVGSDPCCLCQHNHYEDDFGNHTLSWQCRWKHVALRDYCSLPVLIVGYWQLHNW